MIHTGGLALPQAASSSSDLPRKRPCLDIPSPVCHTVGGMAWGSVEVEQEVERWLLRLSDEDFGQAAFYIDLLADRGVHLTEPYTRQLRGKLRELRFYIGRQRYRISYYMAAGRRIILLTVFHKTRQRERGEIDRAERAMKRCIAEGHTAKE